MTEVIADDVNVDLELGFQNWEVTDLTVKTSRYNETDMVEATVIDPDFEDTPAIDSYASLDIDGRSVFTGFVHSVKEKEKRQSEATGKFKVKLMNDLYRAKNTQITIEVTEPTPLSEVVQQVCSQAGLTCVTDLTWRPGDPSQTASDWMIGPAFTDESAASVLDTLAKWANADWWFDNYNILQFGLPDAEIKQIEYVKSESEFGPIDPPYRGVYVVPNGAVSELSTQKARSLRGYNPSSPRRALEYLEDKGTWEIRKGYTNEPTFTFNDESVQSRDTASAISEKLARELLRQVNGGKIKIVGDATIDERDVVELPDFLNGQQYFVGQIKHTLNDSDGFLTEIQCESVVPGDGV